jgi:hypothetical protein
MLTTAGRDGSISDLELVAYTLLEVTRLRCEHLLGGGDIPGGLGAIHRAVGLAGYHASTEFFPDARSECLAVAHREFEENSNADVGILLQTMFEEAITASDALANALALTAGDHLHLAHLYVMSAMEALEHELTARRSAPC